MRTKQKWALAQSRMSFIPDFLLKVFCFDLDELQKDKNYITKIESAAEKREREIIIEKARIHHARKELKRHKFNLKKGLTLKNNRLY